MKRFGGNEWMQEQLKACGIGLRLAGEGRSRPTVVFVVLDYYCCCCYYYCDDDDEREAKGSRKSFRCAAGVALVDKMGRSVRQS